MGVSNLDEVVIVTRAKERFEYRRGRHHHCCADESGLSQREHTGTHWPEKKKKITIRQRGIKIFLRAPIFQWKFNDGR